MSDVEKFSVDVATQEMLKKAQAEMKDIKRLEEETDEVCDKCGSKMVIKWGRYGKFLACSGYPDCKNTRQLAGEGGGANPHRSK